MEIDESSDSASHGHQIISQDELCTLACHKNLIELQRTIQSACKAGSDIFKDGDVIYHGVFERKHI